VLFDSHIPGLSQVDPESGGRVLRAAAQRYGEQREPRREARMAAIAATVRRIGLAVAAAFLAAGLLAAVAPASPAAVARPRSFNPSSTGNGVARIAAQIAVRGTTTGTLTGVVSGIAGAPAGGACITATGPAGARTVISAPDGRYVLRNLRPGGYTMRIGCGSLPASYAWPGLPRVVLVLPGQIRMLAPARMWQAGALGPASGQPQALSKSAATSGAARTGSISGRVTGHGHPLRDICAFAFHLSTGPVKPPARATTSSTGRYEIRSLRPGRYFVLFRTGERSCPSTANWLPQWYPYVNSPYAIPKVAFLRVRAGKDTSHIDGRLKLGGEIAGVVRTSTGQPVKGICASIYSGIFALGAYFAPAAAASSRTGHYALRGLFPGQYQVQFMIGCGSKGNYAAQWWRDRPSPLRANSIRITGRRVVADIDATLVPGAAITGTVTAGTVAAKPLRGVCVNASDDQGDYADGKTGKNGTYRIDGLDTGRYQVLFDPTCYGTVSAAYLPAQRTVSVRAGHALSGVDVSLRPAAGMSGVVRDSAGKPVGSVCVNIDDPDNDSALTSANGRYSIEGVVPGKYSVYFETDCGSPGSLAPQYYDDQPDSDSAQPVTFTGGMIDRDIDATLQPGGTLAGVLTSTSGQPVQPGDCIGLVAPQNTSGFVPFSGGGSTIHGGRYRFADLSPGEYQVSFDCQTGRYADQWFNSQPDSTTAEFLSITPGVTTRLNQKLSLAGAIAGTVTTKTGGPLANICINVANARNKQFISQVNDFTATNRHGRYLVGLLAPGRYLVQFSACLYGGYGSRWYHAEYREASATPVIVRAGKATSRINEVLSIGGAISGTVTGPSGRPASNICAEAYDPASQSFGLAGTDKAGRYTIRGLSNGRYAVFFSPCGPPSPNLGSVALNKVVKVVAPHDRAGADIQLAAGGSITGTVTGPAGPQTQACVFAVPANALTATPVFTDGSGYPLVFTDATGDYVMSGLAAGAYRVYLGDPNCDIYDFGMPGLAAQWYDNQPGRSTATLVSVAAGKATEAVSGTLQPFGGIDGTVTDSGHEGVAGECVTAVPFDAAADPFSGLPPAPDVAITLPSGSYRLLDLPPGQYKIEFSTGCGDAGFISQWWDGAATVSSAKVITVGNAMIGGIDATLRR
jgi:hypothetical protein